MFQSQVADDDDGDGDDSAEEEAVKKRANGSYSNSQWEPVTLGSYQL